MSDFHLQSVGYFAVAVPADSDGGGNAYPTADWLQQEFASLKGVEYTNLGVRPEFQVLESSGLYERSTAKLGDGAVPASMFTFSQFRARIENFYGLLPFATLRAWIGKLNLSATGRIIVIDDIFLSSGNKPHYVPEVLSELKSSGILPRGLAVLPLTFVIVTTNASQDRRERWLRAGADFVCDPVRDTPGRLFERLVERFQKLERLETMQAVGRALLLTAITTLIVKFFDVWVRVLAHWMTNATTTVLRD